MQNEEYFKSYRDYFWQWEENGEVLAIPYGKTIAYRSLVEQVLERLQPNGIPVFGSLLLAVIATNHSGAESLHAIRKKLDAQLAALPMEHGKKEFPGLLLHAFNFLDKITNIPEEYKTGEKKILLLQAIFEKAHKLIGTEQAKSILYTFKQAMPPHIFSGQFGFDKNVFKQDIRVLALLDRQFSGSDVIVAKMASLPAVSDEQVPEKIHEPEIDTKKDFVDELMTEGKTFHTGALIRRIWSGLNIPFHNTIPSGQPLGGISDITNKGDFDRLLLSEFANEDVLFMSRLANNEALYINREIPPENNNVKRVILLDTSIKNWGNQRCIAHALAIAISKHPKTSFECDVYATGYGWYKLDYTTTANVIDSLAFLDGCLHTAQGLEDFLNKGLEGKNVELFFVSGRDASAYAAVQLVLNKHADLFKYWIYADDEGTVELYKKQNKSKKLVQTFRLPLDELWSKPPKQKKQKHDDEKGELGKYPILFPNAQTAKRAFLLPGNEHYKVTPERSLMRFYDGRMKFHEKGWELVFECLPAAATEMEIGIMKNGDRVMLLYAPQKTELTYLNLTTGQQCSCQFHEWQSKTLRNFLFYADYFYYQLRECYYQITVEENTLRVEKVMEKAPNFLSAVYEDRDKRMKDAVSHSYTGGVLKNINDVYINEINNLVLNGHELRLTNYKAIRFEQNKFKNVKKRAVPGHGYRHFEFPDGSVVTVNRAGMIILESINPDIPQIYIPTRLDTILGVATEKEFAGHVYYYRTHAENKQTVISEINFIKKYIDVFINHVISNAT